MNAVVPLFLIAPLILVPLGYRLLEVASPGSWPPAIALRTVLPAAGILVLSFWLPAGPVAAALALPWLAVTGITAVAAGLRLLRDPDRFRPGVRHATDAAVAFLAVGATFVVTDRLGARPFDFPATIILLTAVHFHFAGFVLPLVGALAFARRPSRRLELALGAVIVGIPITALGFFGFPLANWIGTMLTATGGIGLGLGTLGIARTLMPRSAVALAMIAGTSLLITMPLAAIYATGTLTGAAWLGMDLMAWVHGGLNAIGFALPVMVAWTLDRRATAPGPERPHRAPGTPSRRWGFGLVVGAVFGVGVLIFGTLGGLLGLVAVVLLAWEPAREAPVGGFLAGFGTTWLLLFVRADLSYGANGGGPDLTPWYAVGIVMLVVGLFLSVRALRRSRFEGPR